METPLVIAAEAKKNNFEQGWGQCLAELVVAQKINGDSELPVYGIVTDGKLWEFGKLEKNMFARNAEGQESANKSSLHATAIQPRVNGDVMRQTSKIAES